MIRIISTLQYVFYLLFFKNILTVKNITVISVITRKNFTSNEENENILIFYA